MKLYLIFLFTFLHSNIFAQFNISGKVTDIKNGKPIKGVSVYIINSTNGIATNEQGEYIINNILVNRFELIFSAIGYETLSKTIDNISNSMVLDIILKPKPTELEMVTIQAYEKDGWNKWGKLFFDNIIGTTEQAAYCTIENSEQIKFRYNKEQNILQAIANEPIVILNKYLGYKLMFDLQYFEIDLKHKSMFYSGYPFFVQLKGSKNKIFKWNKNKKEAYYDSFMHFLRSVYRNKLNEEGFELRAIKRFPNIEKQRVKNILKQKEIFKYKITINDSLDYYSNINHQSDSLDFVYPNPIKADSIAYMIDSTTIGISFSNHIQVRYLFEKEINSIMPFNGKTKGKQFPVSIITMINTTEIIVLANGSYFDPLNVFCEDYWGFTEKLSTLLPVDYTPN